MAIPKDIGLHGPRKDASTSLKAFDTGGFVLLAVCTASFILSVVSTRPDVDERI